MPSIKDLNTVGNLSTISNAGSHIRDINKRYPGNKTMDKDVKASILITVSGLVFGVIVTVILMVLGIKWDIAMLGFLFGSILFLIPTVIIYAKVINAGLDAGQRIALNEGYGQFVWLNGEGYFVEYNRPVTLQEAVEMANQHLAEKQTSMVFHIYKLFNIKRIYTKKYKGKLIDVISFTYDMVTNPYKTEVDRLGSISFAIWHDDFSYKYIMQLSRFEETEEDRKKDLKDIRKGFIIATIVLLLALLVRINVGWFFIIPGIAIMVAWECASNQIKSHGVLRFILKSYIVIVSVIGMMNLYFYTFS